MSNIERILRHMFHSKYVFFRPRTIARHINLKEKGVTEILEEKHVAEIIGSMERSGAVKKTSINNTAHYFLTPASTWILRNLLGWRR